MSEDDLKDALTPEVNTSESSETTAQIEMPHDNIQLSRKEQLMDS